MRYKFVADTDIGTTKDTNQDSLLVKHGIYSKNEVLMAIVCDGMGGLSKGELASATVIRAFNKWFDKELPYELDKLSAKIDDFDLGVIGAKWSLALKELNIELIEYSEKKNITMGTTFTGMLFIGDKYMITHVGDSRAYYITDSIQQLTSDQTFIAREIERGTMTLDQAENDKRRNMLLQCVGASDDLEPDIYINKLEKGAYMLCSDGFRHEIDETEMVESLNPVNLINEKAMKSNVRYLIELNKKRNEKDNISAILVKVD